MKEMFIEIPLSVLDDVLEILKVFSNYSKEEQEKVIKELEKITFIKKIVLDD